MDSNDLPENTDWLTRGAATIDDVLDSAWRRVSSRLGLARRPQIQPYIGYANRTHIHVHGRVLSNPPAELPESDDKWWENIAHTYRRFASNEIPGVNVQVSFGGEEHLATSDSEGYFTLKAGHHSEHFGESMWSQAICKVVGHDQVEPDQSAVTCKLMMPPADAEFGVISDVDDTVVHTEATQLLAMIKHTMLSNARTRVPLDGVSALYHALAAGNSKNDAPRNPIFYVSSSPWNLFDVIEDIFELNHIPLGPILLRDLGFDRNKFFKEGHEHKLRKVRRLMESYPDMKFLLVGDSGQDDAMLYAHAAEEFGPQRIIEIYIRDVDPNADSKHDLRVAMWQARSEAAGVRMHRVRDSGAAAMCALSSGLLHESRLPEILEAVKQDVTRKALGS